MMKKFLYIGLLLCCISAQAQNSFSLIDSLRKEIIPVGGNVCISIYDLTANKTLYNYQEKKLTRPASTAKLMTTITYLSKPYSKEHFHTEVWYDGTINQDTLKGDIYVVGGFDPEFGIAAMNKLVDRIANLPFNVISGHIYGDISMKDSLYWDHGWCWDDNPESFQPYLSPLMFHKDFITITAYPSTQPGTPARLVCSPTSTYYTVTNETKSNTYSAGRFSATRGWMYNSNNIIVRGNVTQPCTYEVNLFSSEKFFMHVFLEQLQAKGIKVNKDYSFREFHRNSNSVCIIKHETSVKRVIKQMLLESDNLNAEALLYHMAALDSLKKHISSDEGLNIINNFIKQLGYDPQNYNIKDACGLSIYDLVSPELLIDFLKYAYAHPKIFKTLYRSLPIAGVKGTLKNRMKRTSAYANVHAKTGTCTAVSTLAGYLKMRNGHRVAFAVLCSNILSDSIPIKFQDKVCTYLCNTGISNLEDTNGLNSEENADD